jgi:HEAT repeat protein
MAKTPSVEERLAEVARIRDQPQSREARKELRKHLSSKISLIVAKAAEIVAESADTLFAPDLIQAFRRFMVNPAKTDKGCLAKTAIMRALLATECEEEAIFLEGIHHVQLEPAWGGPADTAAELRALSGLGLAQMGSRESITELAILLADKEPDARIGAAHALGQTGREEATALVLFKVLTGDGEPAVVAECFNALMALSPARSLPFVARFVSPSHHELTEAAALALGESRLPEAFEVLREKYEKSFDPHFRRMLLLPIALVRQDAAQDFLLSVVETADVKTASAAIAALAIYRGDERVRERLTAAIEGPHKSALLSLVQREFG